MFHPKWCPIDIAVNKRTFPKLSYSQCCTSVFMMHFNTKLSARKVKTETTFISLLKGLSHISRVNVFLHSCSDLKTPYLKLCIQNTITVLCCFKAATMWTWTHPWPPVFNCTGQLHTQKTMYEQQSSDCNCMSVLLTWMLSEVMKHGSKQMWNWFSDFHVY